MATLGLAGIAWGSHGEAAAEPVGKQGWGDNHELAVLMS